jgi:hypothetical protein
MARCVRLDMSRTDECIRVGIERAAHAPKLSSAIVEARTASAGIDGGCELVDRLPFAMLLMANRMSRDRMVEPAATSAAVSLPSVATLVAGTDNLLPSPWVPLRAQRRWSRLRPAGQNLSREHVIHPMSGRALAHRMLHRCVRTSACAGAPRRRDEGRLADRSLAA